MAFWAALACSWADIKLARSACCCWDVRTLSAAIALSVACCCAAIAAASRARCSASLRASAFGSFLPEKVILTTHTPMLRPAPAALAVAPGAIFRLVRRFSFGMAAVVVTAAAGSDSVAVAA